MFKRAGCERDYGAAGGGEWKISNVNYRLIDRPCTFTAGADIVLAHIVKDNMRVGKMPGKHTPPNMKN